MFLLPSLGLDESYGSVFGEMSVRVDVLLSPKAMRRALDMLETGTDTSLDSLIERLLLEQAAPDGTERSPEPTAKDAAAPLAIVTGPPDHLQDTSLFPLRPADRDRAGRLPFLTNRLNPMKLVTRVIADSRSREGTWPIPGELYRTAGVAARDVGQRLRHQDQRSLRKGFERRWVGYPIGPDFERALGRFVFSFAATVDAGVASGPLWLLGLANADGDRLALTDAGWELAVVPSPILDGEGTGTMNAEEAAILRQQLFEAPDELAACAELLRAVHRGGGVQQRVDHQLNVWHEDWTVERVAAERSAMVGRLGELGVIKVSGRGGDAQIKPTAIAEELEWVAKKRSTALP